MSDHEPTLLQYIQQIDAYMQSEYPAAALFIMRGLMPPNVQERCSRMVWDSMLSGLPVQQCCGDIASVLSDFIPHCRDEG